MANNKKEYKFTYIDDLNDTTGTTRGFSVEGGLKVYSERPLDTLEEQINRIKDQDIDGIILDLRLDDYENDNKKKVQFRGTTLAQEIRTRQKEGEIKQFPIFLFSGNDNIVNSLNSATSGIFDLCIEKESIDSDKYEEYQNYFIAIAESYQNKIHNSNAFEITQLIEADALCIDSFISDLNIVIEQSHTTTSLVNFIINEIFNKDSVLISEDLLACRLGIDKTKSHEAWDSIKEQLTDAKYVGVLSGGWDRWWMHKVEAWWRNIMEGIDDMQYISADDRAAALAHKFELPELFPPDNIPRCNHRDFWTLCMGLHKPLDVLDGIVIVSQDNLYSWQDVKYVSIECALTGKNKGQWIDIASYEKLRFKELQEVYKRKR